MRSWQSVCGNGKQGRQRWLDFSGLRVSIQLWGKFVNIVVSFVIVGECIRTLRLSNALPMMETEAGEDRRRRHSCIR